MSLMLKLFTVLFLVISFVGCSSISVNSDYDPATDFSKYKTYKWGSANNPNDALLQNQLILSRVFEAIDKTLESKGYKKVKSNPDFLVYPHADTKDRKDINTWGYGYGGWWGVGPYGGLGTGNIDVTYYTEGTLFIDIVDGSGKKLTWRGVGTGVVNKQSSPEKSTQNIDDAVAQILQNFPPQPKNNN